MKNQLRNFIKSTLTSPGKPAPLQLQSFVGLLNFGHWMKTYELQKSPGFQDRNQLFRFINDEVNRGEPIDYLEFGVYQGESIETWTKLNRNPSSRFWGFDSFEGLPEDWATMSKSCKKGTFGTGGRMPALEDARVVFVKGWFQHTLPGFLAGFQSRNHAIVHLDADLYSSTLYVLSKLDQILTPGSIVIFDDFGIVTGVFRALSDYTQAYLRKYRVVAHQGECSRYVALQFG